MSDERKHLVVKLVIRGDEKEIDQKLKLVDAFSNAMGSTCLTDWAMHNENPFPPQPGSRVVHGALFNQVIDAVNARHRTLVDTVSKLSDRLDEAEHTLGVVDKQQDCDEKELDDFGKTVARCTTRVQNLEDRFDEKLKDETKQDHERRVKILEGRADWSRDRLDEHAKRLWPTTRVDRERAENAVAEIAHLDKGLTLLNSAFDNMCKSVNQQIADSAASTLKQLGARIARVEEALRL